MESEIIKQLDDIERLLLSLDIRGTDHEAAIVDMYQFQIVLLLRKFKRWYADKAKNRDSQ